MKPTASTKGFGKASPLLAALFAALVCGVPACASEEGTTPECKQDIDEDGHNDVDNGCNPFAACIANGKVSPATECCKDVTGYELEACLYGYGAGPEPGGAGGGGGN